ncbi:TatD family hydrolase [Fulvivirgaceae bacterium BMA12]|uniref:TatD family hydrolase n=1 Tax=Agaribacillus aureus TaxID=3051825 RepID=A0ABT8L3C3_9BACT|nr:TatD family hydrolase [Fulvivirgaceae bacterium BMA12]
MPDFIDTHAHIYLDNFKDDIEQIIAECKAKGVNRIFMPNIDHSSSEDMLALESRFPETCFAMMGLHPCSVKPGFEKELYEVERFLAQRKFIAVGEMGIDLYWDKSYLEEQKEAFTIQVNLALKHQLPIVIHCRESFEEAITLVETLNNGSLRGVFHCFTGTREEAQRVIEQGFYLGLGGVTTFKNGGMDKVVPFLDMDYILLETDSPYLSPVPYRGKRNQPGYIPIIAERIAQLKNITIDEVAKRTTLNAEKLFGV